MREKSKKLQNCTEPQIKLLFSNEAIGISDIA